MYNIEKSKEELLKDLEKLKNEIESIKIAYQRDISALEKAEEDLKLSEITYKGMLNEVTEIIYIQDEHGRFLDVNRTTEKIYGYSSDHFIGKTIDFISAPEMNDLEKIEIAYESAINGKPQSFEFWGISKNGKIIQKEVNISPGLFFGKKAVISVARDITQRKLAELALLESEKKFRKLADEAPVLIWESDVNKQCIFFNKVWLNFTGRTLEQEAGFGWINSVHHDDLEKCLETYNSNFDLQQHYSMEYRLLHHSGEYRWISENGSPRYSDSGEFLGFIGSNFDITKRKKAEEDLKLSEITYRGMLNEVSESIYIYGENHKILDINATAEKVLGYHRDYLIGNTFELFSAPGMNDLNMIEKSVEEALKGNTQCFEFWCITKSGKIYPSEVNISLGTYFGKKAIISIARDITERKQAEKNLIASISLLDTSLDSTADGILIVNSQGKITKWNNKFSEMWNLSHELLSSKDDALVINHILNQLSEPEIFVNKIKYLYENPEETSFDQIKFLNGRIFERYSQAHRIGENIVGRVWSFRDITKRKTMEEALIESEEKLSTLFASMTEMVVLHELVFNEQNEVHNYKIIDCNNTFSNITGIKKEDAVGKLATEIYKTEPAPYLEIYSEVAITGKPYEYTTYFQPMDKYFTISVVSPKKNQFATITTDITAIKQIEEVITIKNKELENYLYVASHDLRSPLVNIHGFSQRLQKKVDLIKKIIDSIEIDTQIKLELDLIFNDAIPKTLEFVFTNVTKMDALINGLLQISRTGRVVMTIKQIDMNQLFESIVNSTKFQINELNAQIKINNLPQCYGDEHLLNQLFSNIITNAIRYRDKNRQLMIEINSIEHYNKQIYIIKDNGIGIAPRHLEKIWDVFYRVNSASKESGEGLGLSIVKRIADKHKGKVWVESEEGVGSIFYIELLKNEFME